MGFLWGEQLREGSGEETREPPKLKGPSPETSAYLCLAHISLHPTLPELFHFLSEKLCFGLIFASRPLGEFLELCFSSCF